MFEKSLKTVLKSVALPALTILGILMPVGPVAGQVIAETTFDDQTTQGWTGVGVRSPGPVVASPGPSGDPNDHYFEVTDRASTGGIPGLAILAPEAFLGRYGTVADSCGTLELDVRVFDDQGGQLRLRVDFARDPDGFMAGADPELRARFRLSEPIDESTGWYHVVIPLSRRDSSGGLPSNLQGAWEMASDSDDSEWNALLDDVDLVYLPLEINSGTFEKVGIDNVRLVAGECPCPTEPNRSLLAGVPDDFAAPNDPARRAFLGSVSPPPNWKTFDDTGINRWLGHTFVGLPTTTVAGELEIRMQPGNSLNVDNDSILLGLGPDARFLLSRRISTLPEAGGTWTTDHNGPTTFRIVLNQDLLDRIVASRRLEMAVQDDTTVDFAILRLVQCPPPATSGGNPLTTGFSTDGLPNLDGGWTFRSPTGQIEFELDMGEAEGNCVGVDELCLTRLGSALDLAAIGQQDELIEDGELIGTLEFGPDPSGVGLTSDFFEPFLTRTEVLSGGQVLAGDVGEHGLVAVLPEDVCVKEIDFLDGNCFQVLLTEPAEILLPRSGDSAIGDRVKICRDLILGGSPPPSRMSRFEVSAEGLEEIRVTEVTVQQHGVFYRALGEAQLQATGNSLVVSGLEGGDDGVVVDVDETAAARLALGTLTLAASEPTFLELDARGQIDGAPGSLGRVRVEEPAGGGLRLQAEFSDLGVDSQIVRIFDHGRSVAELPEQPTGSSLGVSALPVGLGALAPPGGPISFVCEWPAGTLFTFGGAEYRGDELRVEAPGTSGLAGILSEIRIQAGGLETITVTDVSTAGNCDADAQKLCLQQDRFEVEVVWSDFAGDSGSGRAVPLTSDSGYFWFFDAANVEVVVKVLDGREINDHFWVFYGALSTVEYQITVTDTETGAVQRYLNPAGALASVGDTRAFTAGGEPGARRGDGPDPVEGVVYGDAIVLDPGTVFDPDDISGAGLPQAATCVPDATSLCLDGGRFQVGVEWADFTGNNDTGRAVPLSDDTGSFWFFDATNVELVLKVLDGRAINGHFWVFYGALSNVEYRVTVTDTVTGEVRVYLNPPGELASRGDTRAFEVP